MWKDVRMGLFGVAYPAWAGGCEDRSFGGVRVIGMRERLGDFFGGEGETDFSHDVCVDDPSEAIIEFPSCSQSLRSSQELVNHVPCSSLRNIVCSRKTGADLWADACD